MVKIASFRRNSLRPGGGGGGFTIGSGIIPDLPPPTVAPAGRRRSSSELPPPRTAFRRRSCVIRTASSSFRNGGVTGPCLDKTKLTAQNSLPDGVFNKSPTMEAAVIGGTQCAPSNLEHPSFNQFRSNRPHVFKFNRYPRPTLDRTVTPADCCGPASPLDVENDDTA